MRPNRRDAARTLASAGLGALLHRAPHLEAVSRTFWRGSPEPAQHPDIPAWKTELRQLAPNVFAYTQAGGPGLDGGSISNAGVIALDDHLIAIDTLGPPIHAKAFKAAALAATGKRFRRVINTHHHRDHTSGNCFFLPAEIVAHDYCRQAVLEMGIPSRPFAERPEWQEGMHELTLAPPVTTFADRITYRHGETIIDVLFVGPGHTWGDAVVYLPRHKILFGGDVAFWYITPAAHNGHVSKWLEAIDRISRLDVETIVPGHGPIGGRKELMETRAYLELLKREARRRYDAGMRPGQAAADIDLERFGKWANAERVVVNTVRLYAEFDGTIGPSVANLASPDEATRQAVEEYRALEKGRAPGAKRP